MWNRAGPPTMERRQKAWRPWRWALVLGCEGQVARYIGLEAGTWLLLMLIASGRAAPMDMCGGGSETKQMTNGALTGPAYPELTIGTEPTQCTCNFSTNGQTALLYTQMFLNSDFPAQCDPVLLLGHYQVCPAAGSNRSLNVLIQASEQVRLTMNNPNNVPHIFYVRFSSEHPLGIQCGPTAIAGLPPGLRTAGYAVPPNSNTEERDANAHLPAVIASIVVVAIFVGLIVAGIIRWRCVVAGRKKKSLTMDGTIGGDNPAFQHTPKSSMFDIRREGANSVSSLIGVGRDLQPGMAPLTGIGALTAHSEPPQRRNILNGGPPPRSYSGFDPRSTEDSSPTPPQPRRRAPDLNEDYTPGLGRRGPCDDTNPDFVDLPTFMGRDDHPDMGRPSYGNHYPSDRYLPRGGHPGQGGGPYQVEEPIRPDSSRPLGSHADLPYQDSPDRQSPRPSFKAQPEVQPEVHGPLPGGRTAPAKGPDPSIRAPFREPKAYPVGPSDLAKKPNYNSGKPRDKPLEGKPPRPAIEPEALHTRPPIHNDEPAVLRGRPGGPGVPRHQPEEADKEVAPVKEEYACGYCGHTEARYGRIICHLLREHPDCDLYFNEVKPEKSSNLYNDPQTIQLKDQNIPSSTIGTVSKPNLKSVSAPREYMGLIPNGTTSSLNPKSLLPVEKPVSAACTLPLKHSLPLGPCLNLESSLPSHTTLPSSYSRPLTPILPSKTSLSLLQTGLSRKQTPDIMSLISFFEGDKNIPTNVKRTVKKEGSNDQAKFANNKHSPTESEYNAPSKVRKKSPDLPTNEDQSVKGDLWHKASSLDEKEYTPRQQETVKYPAINGSESMKQSDSTLNNNKWTMASSDNLKSKMPLNGYRHPYAWSQLKEARNKGGRDIIQQNPSAFLDGEQHMAGETNKIATEESVKLTNDPEQTTNNSNSSLKSNFPVSTKHESYYPVASYQEGGFPVDDTKSFEKQSIKEPSKIADMKDSTHPRKLNTHISHPIIKDVTELKDNNHHQPSNGKPHYRHRYSKRKRKSTDRPKSESQVYDMKEVRNVEEVIEQKVAKEEVNSKHETKGRPNSRIGKKRSTELSKRDGKKLKEEKGVKQGTLNGEEDNGKFKRKSGSIGKAADLMIEKIGEDMCSSSHTNNYRWLGRSLSYTSDIPLSVY